MQCERCLLSFLAAALVAVALGLATDSAHGQMFGPRRLGQSLARRPGPGAPQSQEEIGSLQGNERFLRANRRPSDFVGPDVRELQRFIGALQARARAPATSTTEGLRRRVDRSETMNQALTPTAPGGPYHPRLEVSFQNFAPEPGTLDRNALDALVRSPQMSATSRIVVLVAGRTAILRGEVPSRRDRDLAELLLAFEPGISAIQNELTVNPDLRPSQESLGALREQQMPREAWTTMSHATHAQAPDRAAPSVTRRSY